MREAVTKTAFAPLVMLGLALGCSFGDVSIGDPLGDEAGSESGSDTGTGSDTGPGSAGDVDESGSADGTDTTTTDDATTTDTTAEETTTADGDPPEQPQNLALSYEPIKQFQFTWTAAAGAETYQLLERENQNADYVPVGMPTPSTETSLTVPIHLRVYAGYIVRACNDFGCTDSEPVAVVDTLETLETAIGYFKASNTGAGDRFGQSVAMSADGSTLAVGAPFEDSNATGIDGDESDDSAGDAGAVYVFVRDPQDAWSQQAYVKASNTGEGDEFGKRLALSEDGSTLAIGATEDSCATGIDDDQADNSCIDAGAVYVLVRDGQGDWSQQAYIKASNTGTGDDFGSSVALSGDGDTLVVGAADEGSGAIGIDGDQANNSLGQAGAAYVFVREQGAWSQQAYVKASNTGVSDRFGCSVALNADGSTLAVGAYGEDSNATGINGNQFNGSAPNAGAVYVFVREQGAWSQQAYVKASNTDPGDLFGWSMALSGDGDTLAVGAWGEASTSWGINGIQADNGKTEAGAAYVFVRDGQGAWSQQAYVKASYVDTFRSFGWSMALSEDGDTLAVGAVHDPSGSTGIEGAQMDYTMGDSGAAYVFVRQQGAWSQRAYVKASNTDGGDWFGYSMALNGEGTTLAIAADAESSNAEGIGGDQADNSADDAGAVYLY